jgi:FixJ family two-component response regulator
MTVSVAIVDDDIAILDSVRLLLELQSWQVATYSTGEAFLAELSADRLPDCLILDPHLPGISGAEVADAVANLSDSLPIIGLTARPTSPITQAVLKAGAEVMLLKPVSADALVDTVQLVLGKTSANANWATGPKDT